MNAKLRVSAEVEIVRIEQGNDPRVVMRLARGVAQGLRLQGDGPTTALRVGESYSVDIDVELPSTATLEEKQ